MKNVNENNVYFWHKITIKDKALLYEHLSNLIDGGVTLTNALKGFLEKTQNPKLALEISNLLLFIESGDSFSTGMKKMPFVFDKKEIAVIEAGESSGALQKSLLSLSKQMSDQEILRSKVKGALTYPLIILVFLIIAVFVIMIYVIPKLRPLFETTGIELPLSTKALIFTSEFFSNNFYLIIIFLLILYFSLKTYIKTESGKAIVDGLYLKLPLVGMVYKNYVISQVSSNLGLLIGAGIPIVKTLNLTGESSNNVLYKDAIDSISKHVSSGKKITQSIEEVDPEHRYFTNDFIQMIAAGEQTSTINKVCEKISAQYSREVDSSLGIMIKWIEPGAIAIAGVFVLWFAFAIFSAVLKITETVG